MGAGANELRAPAPLVPAARIGLHRPSLIWFIRLPSTLGNTWFGVAQASLKWFLLKPKISFSEAIPNRLCADGKSIVGSATNPTKDRIT